VKDSRDTGSRSERESEKVATGYENLFNATLDSYQSVQRATFDALARYSDLWQKMLDASSEPARKAAENTIKTSSNFSSEQIKIYSGLIEDTATQWNSLLNEYNKNYATSVASSRHKPQKH
jgi:hypothetical protein